MIVLSNSSDCYSLYSFPIGIPPSLRLWLRLSILLFITFKPLLYVITRKHFFIIIWLRVKCGPPSAYQWWSGSGDSSEGRKWENQRGKGRAFMWITRYSSGRWHQFFRSIIFKDILDNTLTVIVCNITYTAHDIHGSHSLSHSIDGIFR